MVVKCYNCGKIIEKNGESSVEFFITIKSKKIPVCSEECKKSADEFLTYILFPE